MDAIKELAEVVDQSTDTATRLRALWTLHLTGGLRLDDITRWAADKDEWVRAWMLQLYYERADLLFSGRDSVAELADRSLESLAARAADDPSPLVRMAIASAVQRIPASRRQAVVQALLKHSEDAADHNLPLMYWFAMQPLVANQPDEMLTAALDTKLPKILNFTTRRIASLGTPEARDLIAAKLGAIDDSGKQLDMLNGLSAALKGQRSVPMPKGWDTVETKLASSPNADVRTLAQSLSLTFGSQNALAALRKTVSDSATPAAARRVALDSLVGVKDPSFPRPCRSC